MTDIWLKDSVNDTGPEPYAGNDLAVSPDILVYQTSKNPGAQAALEVDPAPAPENVKLGQTNYVYLRIRNRQAANATGVTANVYWAQPGTLATPTGWNLIGTVTNLTVPGNTATPKVVEFQWPSASLPSASGHYCFVATVDASGDAGPGAPASISFTDFATWVKDHNNVTWRNFDVVSMGAGAGMQRMFHMPGDPREELAFEFRVHARLPEAAQLHLEVSKEFAHGLSRQKELCLHTKGERLAVELLASGVTQLGEIRLAAKSHARAVLHVQWPKELPPGHAKPALIWVSQLYRGKEIGRITWSLTSEHPKPAC